MIQVTNPIEKNAQCDVTTDTGAVYFIDDYSSNSVAKHQFDVVIGENTIETGTTDSCISSEFLGETSTDEVHIIDSEFHEPILGLCAPSDESSDTPTILPTSGKSSSLLP